MKRRKSNNSPYNNQDSNKKEYQLIKRLEQDINIFYLSIYLYNNIFYRNM